jgi:hypothetical protein
MANTERIEQLLTQARRRSTQISTRLTTAKTDGQIRSTLGEATYFQRELQEQRRELAAELSEVRARLAAGRPPRQHRTTWARVEADLLADGAQCGRGLAALDTLIQEQERLTRRTQPAPALPSLAIEPTRPTTRREAATRTTSSPMLHRLRRMVIWVAGGLGVVLVMCGAMASLLGSPDKAAPTPTGAQRGLSATEAADLWTPAPEIIEVTRIVEVTRVVEQTVVPTIERPIVSSGVLAAPEVTASQPTDTPEPMDTAAPTDTPRPTNTPTATPVPSPSAAKDANLRGGPGTDYPIVGGVKAGAPLNIVERTSKGDWYRLASSAWIASFLVQNPPSNPPIAKNIPAPPPKPTATVTPIPYRAVPIPTLAPAPSYSGCCKICRNSKACGDSCISWGKTCHKGPGCACQG